MAEMDTAANTSQGGAQGASEGVSSPSPTSTPIALSDDSLFTPPGATEPVKWGDYSKGFVSRKDHDAIAKQVRDQAAVQQMLDRAEQIDRARITQQQQRTAQPVQAVNPLDEIRGKQFLSGDMVAKIAEQFQGRQGTYEEWATAVNQILGNSAKQNKALENRLKSFETTRDTQAQQASIRSLSDGALKHAGFDPSNKAFASVAEGLRAIAESEYFGYEPGEGQTREEFNAGFPKRFTERMASMRKTLRELERIEAEQARAKLIPGRGGQGTPSNGAKPGFLTPRQRADAFFPSNVTAT